jgi:TolB-like protein/tetratricopeptide (TPR) repeat protein
VNETNELALSKEAIRTELTRVLQSPLFAQSERLGRFLRFAVEHALSGTQDVLKEYVIGAEVYDRRPPYHPSQDSIVRTEARRLRSKLKEYYESEGKDDPIFIYFRPGSYVPVFRSKVALDSDPITSAPASFFVEGAGVSIAVIPFLDLSGGALSFACAQGITDELVHKLMKTEGCRVIAASSLGKLEAYDLPALVERLGVQIVFEGTVREEGTRVRITSRVVNSDGFQIWSQRFEAEAEPSSLFTLQEQVASALLSRVAPRQSVVRKFKMSAGPSLLTLYPSILTAEALVEEGTAADTQAALAKFKHVAQSAPDYARAHCGIAQCYYAMAQRGVERSADLVAEAKKASARALMLDPEMIEAHSAMATALAMEWKWADAENYFQQALQLGSHHAAYRQYAAFLSALGRFDEAWSYLQIAQQIDPFSYRQKASYARFLYHSRRYEEAEEHFANPFMYGPLPLEALAYRAFIQMQLGRHEEAKQIGRTIQRSAGAQPLLMAVVAGIFALCGETPAATGMVTEFGLLTPSAHLSNFRKASLSMALGNPSETLNYLEEACAGREAELPWLGVDPRFDPIRDTPQYREIVSKVRAGASS